jgi:uncharacterized protein YcgI (DUF1989 family)
MARQQQDANAAELRKCDLVVLAVCLCDKLDIRPMADCIPVMYAVANERARCVGMPSTIGPEKEDMDRCVHDIFGILEDTTLLPGRPWGRKLLQGQHLRIIDLGGKQAVDFLCYESDDPKSRYNAANTMKMAGNIFLGKGSILWSDRAWPL